MYGQVRNAQKAGAIAVVLADNSCYCFDEECASAKGAKSCEMNEPNLLDDDDDRGGEEITIPTMLIFRNDVNAIKDIVRRRQTVEIEMSWPLPETADYQLWTVPTDLQSKDFVSTFKTVAVALGDGAHFTPHMFVINGTEAGCVQSGQNSCSSLCTNSGRYCSHGLQGSTVVQESLRRLCIWKLYGETDGVGVEWWEYVVAFNNDCYDNDKFGDEECINDAYRAAKVDGTLVGSCMQESGGLTGDVPNSLLDRAIHSQTRHVVDVLPTVLVNGVGVNGRLSAFNVFRAICTDIPVGLRPLVCEHCLSSRQKSKFIHCVNRFATPSPSEADDSGRGEPSDAAPAGKTAKQKHGTMKNRQKVSTKKNGGKKGGGIRGAGSSPSPAVETQESSAQSSTRAGVLLVVGGLELLHAIGEVGGHMM